VHNPTPAESSLFLPELLIYCTGDLLIMMFARILLGVDRRVTLRQLLQSLSGPFLWIFMDLFWSLHFFRASLAAATCPFNTSISLRRLVLTPSARVYVDVSYVGEDMNNKHLCC